MARPPLPPTEKRDQRFTIHLDDDGAARLVRLAKAQRRLPGQLAALLVEDATRQLDEAGA
jgi:predicted transcriptional regulator